MPETWITSNTGENVSTFTIVYFPKLDHKHTHRKKQECVGQELT